MREFFIEPMVGVGPIRIGMTRAEVRGQFGEPHDGDEERDWFLEGFAVDYDASGKVEFIELAESDQFKATLNGRCLHELPADDAVAFVSSIAPYDETDPELGYTYLFPELQLSLWRPLIPEADQDPGDPTGRKFEAVGVGGKGYFDD